MLDRIVVDVIDVPLEIRFAVPGLRFASSGLRSDVRELLMGAGAKTLSRIVDLVERGLLPPRGRIVELGAQNLDCVAQQQDVRWFLEFFERQGTIDRPLAEFRPAPTGVAVPSFNRSRSLRPIRSQTLLCRRRAAARPFRTTVLTALSILPIRRGWSASIPT